MGHDRSDGCGHARSAVLCSSATRTVSTLGGVGCEAVGNEPLSGCLHSCVLWCESGILTHDGFWRFEGSESRGRARSSRELRISRNAGIGTEAARGLATARSYASAALAPYERLTATEHICDPSIMIDVPAAATGARHSALAKCAVQLGCALADETIAKVNANAIAMILAMGRPSLFVR
jgi:hypothetical protein